MPSVLIEDVNWKGIGYAPTLLDNDGGIVAPVTSWLVWGRQEGHSTSLLYRRALAMSYLYDYAENYRDAIENDDDLLRGFYRSLHHGDKNLAWKSRDFKTARQLLRMVNKYADWIVDQTGIEHPNPPRKHPLNWIEKMAAHKKSCEMDFLAGIAAPVEAAFRELVPRAFVDGSPLTDPSLEDYALSPQESRQAKECEELPAVLDYIKSHNLQSIAAGGQSSPSIS